MTTLSPSELIKLRLTDKAAFKSLTAPLTIDVPRLSADGYGDIADSIMSLDGRDWSWSDARANSRKGKGLLAASSGILRDAVALPWLYLKHRQRSLALSRLGEERLTADLSRGGLYLRLDHNFDLVSGGSVAHTAGVINAFRELLPSLTIISTDRLPLVTQDAGFHELTPRYRAGRNVPLFPALTYTDDVIAWWQRTPRPAPGFIYARYSVGNYAGPALRSLIKVPFVCEYNGSAIWIARQWGGKPLYFEGVFKAVEDANLHGADLIVAVAEASKAELVDRGYPAERIMVNPNGVDAEIYRPDIDGAPVRRRLGIGMDETVIGFIGTFGRWHGAEILAAAFADLLREQPNLRSRVRLLLVGDGMTMPETRAALKSGDCLDKVVFAGTVAQSEGPGYLAACDILVSPHVKNPDASRFFGSPTKLFEYMAMGRAIVASDLEQIGGVLKHGETALLVPPGDRKALSRSLTACIESRDLCQALGRAARAEVQAKYTWLKHSKRILDRLETTAKN